MTVVECLTALSLAIWIYLMFFHGGFWLAREREDDSPPQSSTRIESWPAVTAVVPARNEADMLPQSLASLLQVDYPGDFRIILVDDQSSDGTAAVARRLAEGCNVPLTIIDGTPLSQGWTGKVWAMQQGIVVASKSSAPPQFLLLTDADIAYEPDVLRSLVARAASSGAVLTSVMAKLKCESLAERALIPAFIFFFQMLYPFARVNDPASATAGAAGGCMLVDRAALEHAGGIGAIRGALIDDCALAEVLKRQGPIWLGLSNRVTSIRGYANFEDIRRMVARSAYAQLRYSPILLVGTVLGMILVYVLPPLALGFAGFPANLLAGLAYAIMVIAFAPTLRFYNRSPLWGFALPLIAATYLGFTMDSAYQKWVGRGGLWKGRVQADLGKS